MINTSDEGIYYVPRSYTAETENLLGGQFFAERFDEKDSVVIYSKEGAAKGIFV